MKLIFIGGYIHKNLFVSKVCRFQMETFDGVWRKSSNSSILEGVQWYFSNPKLYSNIFFCSIVFNWIWNFSDKRLWIMTFICLQTAATKLVLWFFYDVNLIHFENSQSHLPSESHTHVQLSQRKDNFFLYLVWGFAHKSYRK